VIYLFRAADGSETEREYPMGKAPCLGEAVVVHGKTYRRCYDIAALKVAPNIRSRSHQLPSWYGFRNSDTVWARHLRKLGLDNTSANRQMCVKAQRAPKPAQFDLEAKRNADRAGKLDCFDKRGRPVATSLRGVHGHVARGQAMGDDLKWD
jgi:hypothetical protein